MKGMLFSTYVELEAVPRGEMGSSDNYNKHYLHP